MFEITLTQFTPAQAAKITGVSLAQQRNLRRHGYLQATVGHARFDVFDLARLFVIKILSDKGVGPAHCALGENNSDIASICATGILWSIFSSTDAYEGDHLSFKIDGPPVVPFSSEVIKNIIAEGQRHGEKISEADINFEWMSRAEKLQRSIFNSKKLGRIVPARFFIWWADGTETWANDISDAFEESASDPKYHGATVVIDQESVGAMLANCAGVAFAHIEAVGE